MLRAYLAISVVTLIWAGNFVVAKKATEQFDPFFIASVRIILTAGVFYAMLSKEARRAGWAEWRAFLPLAVTGIAMNHFFFAAGIQRTSPSHSAVIHALIPVFVAVAAWLVIREGMGWRGIAGIAVAVTGALIVVTGVSREEARQTLAGDVLTVIGIIAFSTYTVLGRRLLGRMGSLSTVAFAFLLAVPLVAPFLAWGAVRTDWSRVTAGGWAALAYMFACANLVCYLFHIFALSRLKAGQVAAFSDLQPAIGVSLSVLVGYDRLTPSLIAGAIVALLGVVLVQLPARAALR